MSGEVSAAVAARIAELKTPMTSGVLAYLLVLPAGYLMFLLGVSIWSWKQNRGKEVNVGMNSCAHTVDTLHSTPGLGLGVAANMSSALTSTPTH
jgi:hypothetical protein